MIQDDSLKRFIGPLALAGLLLLVVVVFFQEINFNSLDLGRHLANGREIWHSPSLLYENFYSYTEPNFRFVNHHWLAGVIYYALFLLGGFKILSLFNILLALATFYLAFYLAKKRGGFYWAAFIAWLVVLIMSQRTDIRPESFSYLFILLLWYLLEKASETGIRKYLYFIPLLFLAWVNIHIYYFIGLLMVAFYAAAAFLPPAWHRLWSGGDGREVWLAGWEKARLRIKLFCALLVTCLLNPNTWRGLFYPFNILREYGYEIAENKTVFFIENLDGNPAFFWFKFLLVFLFVSFAAQWLVKKRLPWFEVLLAVFFSAFGLFANRNIVIFSLVAWIIAARNFSVLNYLGESIPILARPDVRRLRCYLGAVLLMALILGGLAYLMVDGRRYNKLVKQAPGLGLVKGSEEAAAFFKESGLSGPIFNNYDLGSALAFWHFPVEKVFVDNRPEAYSVKFFQDIYKPMQESRFTWEEKSRAYGIRTVYFSHTDMTPWARKFLSMILVHPDWTLLYFDRFNVILALTKETDEEIIEKYQISDNSFRSRLREQAGVASRSGKQSLAVLAELAGFSDVAAEIYHQLILQSPGDAESLASLGFLYSSSNRRQDWIKSINYFDRALEAGEKLPGIYNQRGLTHWNLGDYEKAAADWRAALGRDRGNESASYYLSELERLRNEGALPAN